jgi:hypothetical protein
MKVVPERMREVEALLMAYVIPCWVESNPQQIKEAFIYSRTRK